MHRLSIYEVKRICHYAQFFIVSHESFKHLINSLKITIVLSQDALYYILVTPPPPPKKKKKGFRFLE